MMPPTQHRVIGLVGGLSPESTVHYYQLLCRRFNEQAGGLRFPRLILTSLNLQEMVDCFEKDDWPRVADHLADAITRLREAGADFAAILANTPHNAWDHLRDRAALPVLTIMEATALALRRAQKHRVALLGTRTTMEGGFFQRHFREQGIETMIPPPEDRRELDRIVWEELSHGRVETASQEHARRMIAQLAGDGAEAVILGCTELGMLIKPDDSALPLFDTLNLHAEAILARAMEPRENQSRVC